MVRAIEQWAFEARAGFMVRLCSPDGAPRRVKLWRSLAREIRDSFVLRGYPGLRVRQTAFEPQRPGAPSGIRTLKPPRPLASPAPAPSPPPHVRVDARPVRHLSATAPARRR